MEKQVKDVIEPKDWIKYSWEYSDTWHYKDDSLGLRAAIEKEIDGEGDEVWRGFIEITPLAFVESDLMEFENGVWGERYIDIADMYDKRPWRAEHEMVDDIEFGDADRLADSFDDDKNLVIPTWVIERCHEHKAIAKALVDYAEQWASLCHGRIYIYDIDRGVDDNRGIDLGTPESQIRKSLGEYITLFGLGNTLDRLFGASWQTEVFADCLAATLESIGYTPTVWRGEDNKRDVFLFPNGVNYYKVVDYKGPRLPIDC